MSRTRLESVVNRALRALAAPRPGETVVVGLSGGPDSVALLDTLVAQSAPAGFRVVAAHLDHCLRADSADDAAFCRELGARLGVVVHVGVADVRGRAGRERGGIEQAARDARYAFLRGVREREGAAAIAVAHTRDDQAETFLLRLLRGAGSSGLASMRARSGVVLRPLLEASRRDVLEHLKQRGLPSRQDPSNADTSLARNRVRHELLPYLEARFNPRLRETLAQTANVLGQEADLLDAQAEAALAGAVAAQGETFVLALRPLRELAPAQARHVLRALLRRAGGLRGVDQTHLGRLLALARSPAPSGRRLALPGAREARFSFDELRVGPRRTAPPGFAMTLSVPGRVELPDGAAVTARPARGPAVSNEKSAVVAVGAGALGVRTRRAGDRIRSRSGWVRLGRLLMERRVPAEERGALPLVVADDEVVWIPALGVASAAGHGGRYVRLSLQRAGRADGAASRA